MINTTRISDEQWQRLSPLINAGITAQPDERPDLRQAVDALLWQGQQPGKGNGNLPTWVEDPNFVKAIHARWLSDGTAAKLRRMLAAPSDGPELPIPASTPTDDTPATVAPSTEPAQPGTGGQAHDGPAVTPELPAGNQRRADAESGTTRRHRPIEPAPAPPPVTTEMIQHFEQWLSYHYYQYHVSGDCHANELGRQFRPAFETVLEVMYNHWEVANDDVWNRPRVFDPMPDDDWMDRAKHSRAVAMTAEGLDDAFNYLERSVDLLHEVIMRGVPFAPYERDLRDRHLTALSNEAKNEVKALRATVDKLHIAGQAAMAMAKHLESQPGAPPSRAAAATPAPTRSRNTGEPTYLQLAVQWARQHGGAIKPRELAEHLVANGQREPDQLTGVSGSITGAVTSSLRFQRVQRGVYRLVGEAN